jgi:uncharacterized protein YjbI with pentapeptide repeats
LDSERKSSLLQFLCEAALVQGSHESALPIISLHKADLRGADLSGANLNSADLRAANLEAANLEAANLGGANLERADLRGAGLRVAIFVKTNLREAKMSDEQLRTTTPMLFFDATMPDGQKYYEDWLKDRERHEEDGENTRTS